MTSDARGRRATDTRASHRLTNLTGRGGNALSSGFYSPFRDGSGRAARLVINLLLLRSGCPAAVTTNERCEEYIDALVHGRSHEDDAEPLVRLVAASCRESLLEIPGILSMTAKSRGRGLLFYRALHEVQG